MRWPELGSKLPKVECFNDSIQMSNVNVTSNEWKWWTIRESRRRVTTRGGVGERMKGVKEGMSDIGTDGGQTGVDVGNHG